jgi:hypothetical protein
MYTWQSTRPENKNCIVKFRSEGLVHCEYIQADQEDPMPEEIKLYDPTIEILGYLPDDSLNIPGADNTCSCGCRIDPSKPGLGDTLDDRK